MNFTDDCFLLKTLKRYNYKNSTDIDIAPVFGKISHNLRQGLCVTPHTILTVIEQNVGQGYRAMILAIIGTKKETSVFDLS